MCKPCSQGIKPMSKKQQRRSGGITPQFPRSLHSMLSLAEEDGYSDVVAWHPDGKSFQIHDRRKFVKQVMPLYFQQTKFSSFRRQLNIYGFECIHEPGATYDGYFHYKFQRDKPDLVETMTRLNTSPHGRSPTPTKASESKEIKPSASYSSEANRLKLALALRNSPLLKHAPVEADHQEVDHTAFPPSLPFAPSPDTGIGGQVEAGVETDQKRSEPIQAYPSTSQRKSEFATAPQDKQPDHVVSMERSFFQQSIPPTISLHNPGNAYFDDDSKITPTMSLHNPGNAYIDDDSKTQSQGYGGGAMHSGDLSKATTLESVHQAPRRATQAEGDNEVLTVLTEAEQLVRSTEQMLGSLQVARNATEDRGNEASTQLVGMQNSASTIGTIDLGSSARTVGSASDPRHSAQTVGTIDFYESNHTMGSGSPEESAKGETTSTR